MTQAPIPPSHDRPLRASLDPCSPRDFDGHTNFKDLTPSQRLDWLDELIGFVTEFKGAARTSAPLSFPRTAHPTKRN